MNTFKRPHQAGKLGLLVCAAAVFITGCQTIPTDNRTPEQVVQQRAAERWEALVQGDFEKAYSYLAPTSRTIMSLDGYKQRINAGSRAAKWVGAEVASVACPEADLCDATVRVDAELNIPNFRGQKAGSNIEERWVEEDGQWYFFFR